MRSPYGESSSASASGTVRTIRSVTSRPRSFREAVRRVDQVERAALGAGAHRRARDRSRRSGHRRRRTRSRRSGPRARRGTSFSARAARPRRVPAPAFPLPAALLRARAAGPADCGPSRGPSTGRFGFSWTRRPAALARISSFTRSSSAISSAWSLRPGRGPVDVRPTERLAVLEPRPGREPAGRARRPGAPRRSRRAASASGSTALRPAGEVDRVRCTLADAGDRGSARARRRRTASPARSRAGPGRARTRASETRPRRTSRSGAANGGCTSWRDRRRRSRRRWVTTGVQ